jgi:hypothetical protein
MGDWNGDAQLPPRHALATLMVRGCESFIRFPSWMTMLETPAERNA